MDSIDRDTQKKIVNLRKSGKSHRQIANLLGVSVGSAYKYSRGINLTEIQRRRLREENYNKGLGRFNGRPERLEWSRKGGFSAPHHLKKRHTKRELILTIREFYKQYGRIPTKRDMPNIDSTMRRYFGTWNKAVATAGYEPNAVLFSKHHKARDGHVCDSMAETIIDNWLYENDIYHEKSIRYPKSTLKTDFLVGDIYIEYFGLAGSSSKYDKYMEEKFRLAKKTGITLVPLYPNDLFPTIKLEKHLSFLLD